MKPTQREQYSEIFRAEDCGCDVVVSGNSKFRILTLDSIFEQSIYSLSEPLRLLHEHTLIMALVMAFTHPKRVLMLGLGGGSLVRTLYHRFPALCFDVVELRARVIEAAVTLFDVPNDERVNFVLSSAQDYMEQAKPGSVDVIFADLYHANDMDDYQSNVLFLRDCFASLCPTGWLVVNFHDFPETSDPFVKVLLSLFPDCFVGDSQSANFILFCSKSRMGRSIKTFRPQAKALEEMLQQPLMVLFGRIMRIRPDIDE